MTQGYYCPILTKEQSLIYWTSITKLDKELLISSVKCELRNLKIESILNSNLFNLSHNNVEKFKNELSIIRKEFPNGIICGSLALNLLGIINRDINDVDVLIESGEKYKYNLNKGDYNYNILTNRLGNIILHYRKNIFSETKEFLFDLYENKNCNNLTFKYKNEIIKIQNPLDIIRIKLEMFKARDFGDGSDFLYFLNFCK